MSATRILVLGAVREFGRAHGYQVRRELVSWGVEGWAKVAPGSIYQALRTLTKHGMLEPVATEAGGAGPERTVYAITAAGELEFFRAVRTALADPAAGPEALNAAFGFLHLLPREEAAALLTRRELALRSRLLTHAVDPPPEKPPQVRGLARLHSSTTQAELDWTVEMAHAIRTGAYSFADDAISPLINLD